MKRKITLVASVLLITLGFTASGLGQWVQTNLTNRGDITCLASSGKNINAGTADSGLYFSDDMGETWSHSIYYKSGKIYFLAYIDGNFFICTDTRAIAGNNDYLFKEKTFNGILRSTDNGISWTTIYSLTNEYVHALAVNGTNIFAGTWEYGIYRSIDNGLNWSKANNGLLNTYVNVFYILGDKIFAGTNGGGVFLSSDNGNNWNAVNNGLGDTFINSLAIHGNILFAGTEYGGVFISSDMGLNWKAINNGLKDTNIRALVISDNYLFCGTTSFTGLTASGVWRRPLSDFGINSVPSSNPSNTKLISFPNPLSSKTTISFSNERREFVSVNIIDVLGKECANLFSGELDAGDHSYEWDASRMPPGMYLCLLRENGIAREIPMIVIR